MFFTVIYAIFPLVCINKLYHFYIIYYKANIEKIGNLVSDELKKIPKQYIWTNTVRMSQLTSHEFTTRIHNVIFRYTIRSECRGQKTRLSKNACKWKNWYCVTLRLWISWFLTMKYMFMKFLRQWIVWYNLLRYPNFFLQYSVLWSFT